MPPTVARVTAAYELRGDGWIATVVHGKGTFIAHGRTLEKAREGVVDELARGLDVYAGQIAVDDEIGVSGAARAAVDNARRAREEALRATAESSIATAAAAAALEAEQLSLRDIAYLLGLSHSRVHQLLGQDESTKGKRSA